MKKSELIRQSIATIEKTLESLEKEIGKDDPERVVRTVMGALVKQSQDRWESLRRVLSHAARLWETKELQRKQNEKEKTL